MTDEAAEWVEIGVWAAAMSEDADSLVEGAEGYEHFRPRWITGICERLDAAGVRAAIEVFDGAGAHITHFALDEWSTSDQYAFDPTPDRCWRCDALPACNDLGLCDPCHASLT